MSSENRVTIRVDHVSKIFNVKGGRKIHALDDFVLDVYENEFLSIVGPSGCGKSTLLFIMAGLAEPTSGAVYYRGEQVTGPDPSRGVVFQEDAVFPWLSVRDNVAYGPRHRGLPRKEVNEIVGRYLDLVGLTKYDELWPKQLSGGMRKRVDLARVLANDPDALLMDEPFGALDVMTKQNLQIEIGNLFSGVRKTVFFVTHDLEEAIFLADRVVVATNSPGKIQAIVDVLFERPRPPSLKTSREFQLIREELNTHFGYRRELEGGEGET